MVLEQNLFRYYSLKHRTILMIENFSELSLILANMVKSDLVTQAIAQVEVIL